MFDFKDKFQRIIIGIDPAITSHEESDETGIIVAGLGFDDKAYILEDLSGRYTPSEWAKVVIQTYWSFKADRVVAEVNQGGDLVEHTLRIIDPLVSYKSVRATRGKVMRAEPIAALYEQKHVYHVKCFEKLETQMCHFFGSNRGGRYKSPDRVDALVWVLTELMLLKEENQGSRIWIA